MTTPPDDGEARPADRRSGLGCALELIETLVLTLVIFFVIQNFVAQPFNVHMSSMEHSFEPDQYVLVDRLSHLWSPYARGQVVVFQSPELGEPDPFIKRVIGLPGETVEVKDGKVFVNGTALDEPYLFRDEAGLIQPTEPSNGVSRWVVPPGELFVMGDHRQVSVDSRSFGPIPISSVIGRAILRYWPLSEVELVQTPAYGP